MIEKLRIWCIREGSRESPPLKLTRRILAAYVASSRFEVRADPRSVQAVAAQLVRSVGEQRDFGVEARREQRVAVHVDDRYRDGEFVAQPLQARDHLLAEVAAGASVDRQLQPPRVTRRSHWA